MILATNKKGEGIEPIEAGSYCARVWQMIELGTIPAYQGQMQRKVRIGFELPTELHVFDEKKGEQPRVISQEYTLSFHEKSKLRKVIEACDPEALKIDEDGLMEEFDIEKLIGKVCLITIAQKPKTDGTGNYSYIDNCTRLPKGMKCPPAVNPTQVLSYDKWNEDMFQKLPIFLREKIEGSDEFKKVKDRSNGIDYPDNDLTDASPF